ncbi:MAG: TatD family nuclease-associated radical SAM protein [Clostridia bacterium]|nr:TatD family nuclease-associated radical SAM protein [Clostridia bacterium]
MAAITITYPIGNKLYVNVTNRCTNRCKFCIRYTPSGIGNADLWLIREPTVQEIISDILKADLKKYNELVFCGYGEPLIRFDDVMAVCRAIKKESDIKIRINTNGHANRIAGRDVTPEMNGLVDVVSISLNAKNAKEYQDICVCEFGEDGFFEMLDFAKKAKKYVPEVILSVVDVLSKKDIEECAKIAEDVGVDFRVRAFSE